MTDAIRWTGVRRVVGAVAGMLLILSAVVRASPAQPAAADQRQGAASSVPAARFGKNVVIITIDREIDATMARSVERRLKAAAENQADAVVFELDTPGGSLTAVLDITEMIKTSPIPNTVAWVHTKAYSGGAIIAMACREIVVSTVARLGDAAPIAVTPVGRNMRPLSETERQKILAPLLADLVDSARRRGHDEKLVQGMVTLGVELWLVEHKETGRKLFIDRAEYLMLFGEPPTTEPMALASAAPLPVDPNAAPEEDDAKEPAAVPEAPSTVPAAPAAPTDFIPATPTIQGDTTRTASLALTVASNRPVLTPADAGKWNVIEKVSDGNTIFTFTEAQLLRYSLASAEVKSDEELKTFFGATNVRRLNESWSEALVVFLTHFIVRGVLIVIFLVALFIEMTHPGVAIPGVIAAAAFILLIAPPILNNMASWWEIAAMVAGILLLAMEIFVIPGFGIAGIVGIVLFLGGLLGTFIGAGAGQLFPDSMAGRSDLMSGVTTMVLSVATAIGIMWFLGKHFGSLPLLNRLVLTDDGAIETSGGLLAAMGPVDRRVARGDVGVALTPLRPAGRVQVGDEIMDVVSDFGFIAAGAKVRIASVEEFRITVEPIVAGDITTEDERGTSA